MKRKRNQLELEILEVLRTRGTLRLDALPREYEARHGHSLDYKAAGFSKLKKLVESLDSVKVTERNKFGFELKIRGPTGISTSLSNSTKSSQTNPPAKKSSTGGTKENINVSNGTTKTAFKLIETPNQLAAFARSDIFQESSDRRAIVAIDCEGVPDHLYLIQIATHASVFIFDCVKLGAHTVCAELEALLSSTSHLKVFHDIHNDALVLHDFGGIELQNTLDTQLLLEQATGDVFTGFNKMLEHFGVQPHPTKQSMKKKMQRGEIFALSGEILQYAADDVALLIKEAGKMTDMYDTDLLFGPLIVASDVRAQRAIENRGARSLCFDQGNQFRFASSELIKLLRPNDVLQPTKLKVHHDLQDLLALLPSHMADALMPYTETLSDIAFDLGEEPKAWAGGERFRIAERETVVTLEDLDRIMTQLGSFGSDNRAGIERHLHHISAIRNREKRVVGLTMRAGRHVTGNTYMITDILHSHSHRETSILFLGKPGSGKTTIVREASRVLSEKHNVFIVDTSNEIAGDGDIKHSCVGEARRMMVKSLDDQSQVMIECVQNHTPEIMVIDEIGRPTEVEAARTCKNRGVRLIASAHGDLRSLVKNRALRDLVGGIQHVTVGDERARADAKRHGGPPQKTKAERAGPPIFEIIVEVQPGRHNEWIIIMNSGEAVDRILVGEEYKVQKRGRNPSTGMIHMNLSLA